MNRSYLVTIIGIIVAFGGTLVIYPMFAIPDRSNLEAYCEDIGGDWWEEESVCRNISDEQCELYGGTPTRVGFPAPEDAISGFRPVCDLSLDETDS